MKIGTHDIREIKESSYSICKRCGLILYKNDDGRWKISQINPDYDDQAYEQNLAENISCEEVIIKEIIK